MPSRIVKRLNCSEHDRPTSACSDEKHRRRLHAHLAGRDRARARARDLRVEVAVDDVVPGAARAAHHEGADEEQQRHARDWGRGARPRWQRARPTTSTAAAAAMRRSAGRRARAAGRGGARAARAYRPSFRSSRRRGRSFAHRASTLPGQRVECAALRRQRVERAAARVVPSASLRPGPVGFAGPAAPSTHLDASSGCGRGLRSSALPPRPGCRTADAFVLMNLTIFAFGLRIALEQVADLFARSLSFFSVAVLTARPRFSASALQRREFPIAGRLRAAAAGGAGRGMGMPGAEKLRRPALSGQRQRS